MATDRRRYGVIEVRFRQRAGIATYSLTIGGELGLASNGPPAAATGASRMAAAGVSRIAMQSTASTSMPPPPSSSPRP